MRRASDKVTGTKDGEKTEIIIGIPRVIIE